jgi:hypothetical protein
MLSSRFAGIPISSSTIDGRGLPQLAIRGEQAPSAVPAQLAGFISEWWPTSNRNGGRLQIGISGRIASEFAIRMPKRRKRGRPRTGSKPVLTFRLAIKQVKKVTKLAELEGVDRSTVLRELIDIGLDSSYVRLLMRPPGIKGRGAVERFIREMVANERVKVTQAALMRAPSVQTEVNALRAEEEQAEATAAKFTIWRAADLSRPDRSRFSMCGRVQRREAPIGNARRQSSRPELRRRQPCLWSQLRVGSRRSTCGPTGSKSSIDACVNWGCPRCPSRSPSKRPSIVCLTSKRTCAREEKTGRWAVA